VDELLADPEIEIVVNLTVPHAHAQVNLAAIEAGKHVYSEKPLAVTREDGKKTLVAAREKGVLLGCAPDTLLGGGLQTCRKLIDDGAIGQPVAAVALFASRGPEAWHPNPDFFYQAGGGPLFDLGPYYLSGLIYLLGPVRRVTGSARISFPERIATSESNRGRRIPVDIPTHVTGTLDFASGPVGTLITSFDVWGHHLPRLEIYGSEGSLSVPDPNIFGGAVKLLRAGQKEWEDIPLTHSAEVGRGIGVADLAHALRYGRPHRASGELGYHVLDVMHTFGEASAAGKHILVESTCALPAPLPVGLPQGHLDAAPA
jgi:predicted dehydrogenase